MPTDVEKLAYLRVSKRSSNMDVKPIDLLRAAAHAIDIGEENYESLLILGRTKLPDGAFGVDRWRCNLAPDSETALLVVAQDINLRKMRR